MTIAWRLYADAGNSALKWAARAGERWAAEGRLPIEHLDAAALEAALGEAGLDPAACERAALVSSRPSLAEAAGELLSQVTGADVALLGRDLHTHIEVDYRDPSEIGQDRLAAAEGARALYGVPVIVLTLGTCMTAQALDDAGVLVGGAIAAGLEPQVTGIVAAVPHLSGPVTLALALLRQGEAASVVGHSTVENLAAGLQATLRGTIEALIAGMREQVGPAPVVATGGDVEPAQVAGARFDRVEPLLVLEGLRAVDEREREPGTCRQ